MLGELPLLQTGNAMVPIQGTKVHGCYCPLTREQLEWQININDVSEQVEKEQNELMQASPSLSSERNVGSNAKQFLNNLDFQFFTGSQARNSTAV